ncbi:MAG TPA: hypothetical protein VGY58_09185 [Gemmataceae bacterium]|nr:hypothetical protein [Gemmataceae bacterium]
MGEQAALARLVTNGPFGMRKDNGVWFALLLCGAIASGCELTGAPPRYQNDPLVLSKKPITGKTAEPSPVLVASAEPVPPPVPEVALASAAWPADPSRRADTVSAKVSDAESQGERKRADFLPTPTPSGPSLPTPNAVSSTLPPADSAEPAKDSPYARAADFSWIQGVLERDPRGRLALRYVPKCPPDAVYGRATLQDDFGLKGLKEGDVVQVWGKFVADDVATSRHSPPRYSIHEVRIVKSGSS